MSDQEVAFQKLLEKAKVALMYANDTVFMCCVMLKLAILIDDKQPTAYTDGKVIGFNFSFFEGITAAERIGVMLHEVLHVAFKHMLRLGNKNPLIWNMACDYVINLIIIAAGFQLPKGALIDNKYKGMSADEVYILLEKECEKNPQLVITFEKSGLADIKIVDETKNPSEAKALDEAIDDILVEAVTQSKNLNEKPGAIPAEIEFYVNKLLKPVIPWHRLLNAFMMDLARDDYSYKRINRRFMPALLPSLYSERCGPIAVGTDCSCSVSDDQYSHYVAEALQILNKIRPTKIDYLQFDTKIKSVYELRDVNDFKKIKFTGRGGTNIEPLMKWAEENKPKALIVLSDGYFSAPKTNPKIPVFWIVHDNPNFTAPFGKVIQFTWDKK